jgi:hypothetical protein
MKFKVGDVVAYSAFSGVIVAKVVDVVYGGIRVVYGRWQAGQASYPVRDSYVCEYVSGVSSEKIGMLGQMPIETGDSVFTYYRLGVTSTTEFASFFVGDVVWLKNPGNYGQDGPYEIVEAVHSRRSVNYCWQGGASHPREVDSAWIVKDKDGEHLVIEFSKRDRLSVAKRENHAGICPRCGGKMVEKMSYGFIGESQFAVKKCLSCGNCL